MMLFQASSGVALVMYFLPAIIAVARRHQSWPAIAVLNFLLGWTGICWVAALIWSLTGVRVDYGGGHYRPRGYY
jgi:Superinfection immunity protein